MEPSRCDRGALDRITQPSPDDIERADNPHDYAADEVDPAPRRVAPATRERREEVLRREVRITQKDIDKHGTTPGCSRCADLDLGNRLSKRTHSDACRQRFYDLFKASDDAKWARAAHD